MKEIGTRTGRDTRERLELPAAPRESSIALVSLLTQKEAAAGLRVSVSYLRASDCPKVFLPGNGPNGQDLVRYRPEDMAAWIQGHYHGEKKGTPCPTA